VSCQDRAVLAFRLMNSFEILRWRVGCSIEDAGSLTRIVELPINASRRDNETEAVCNRFAAALTSTSDAARGKGTSGASTDIVIYFAQARSRFVYFSPTLALLQAHTNAAFPARRASAADHGCVRSVLHQPPFVLTRHRCTTATRAPNYCFGPAFSHLSVLTLQKFAAACLPDSKEIYKCFF